MEPEPILQTLSMRQDFNLDGDSSPLQGTMNTLIQTNRFSGKFKGIFKGGWERKKQTTKKNGVSGETLINPHGGMKRTCEH